MLFRCFGIFLGCCVAGNCWSSVCGQTLHDVDVRQVSPYESFDNQKHISRFKNGVLGKSNLLKIDDVRRDLEIVDFQNDDLDRISEDSNREAVLRIGMARERVKDGSLSPDAFIAEANEIMAQARANRSHGAEESLLPHQVKRLLQIEFHLCLQAHGLPELLKRADISKLLDLDVANLDRIERVDRLGKEELRSILATMDRQVYEEVCGKLDPAQQRKSRLLESSDNTFAKNLKPQMVEYLQPVIWETNGTVTKSQVINFTGPVKFDGIYAISPLSLVSFPSVQKGIFLSDDQLEEYSEIKKAASVQLKSRLEAVLGQLVSRNSDVGDAIHAIKRFESNESVAQFRMVIDLLNEQQRVEYEKLVIGRLRRTSTPVEYFQNSIVRFVLGIDSVQFESVNEVFAGSAIEHRAKMNSSKKKYNETIISELSEKQLSSLIEALGPFPDFLVFEDSNYSFLVGAAGSTGSNSRRY